MKKINGADVYKWNRLNGNEEALKKKEEDQTGSDLHFFLGLCPLQPYLNDLRHYLGKCYFRVNLVMQKEVKRQDTTIRRNNMSAVLTFGIFRGSFGHFYTLNGFSGHFMCIIQIGNTCTCSSAYKLV